MKRITNSKLQSAISMKGFTLIELLVVMAIIGVLMTLLTVNFITIRERARDAQRKSDLSQIQTALELYRSDNGSYPTSLPTCNQQQFDNGSGTVYLKKVPCDPSTNQAYYYYPDPAGAIYTLYACIENENDKDKHVQATQPPEGSVACSPGYAYFVVQNP